METVTIAKEVYEQLCQKAAKVEIIEEVLHQPELSEGIIQELAQAQAVPDAELISHKEMKRKYGVA